LLNLVKDEFMATEKLDLYILNKDEYITPKTPALVKTKPAKYLAITGKDEPGGVFAAKKLKTILRMPVMPHSWVEKRSAVILTADKMSALPPSLSHYGCR